MAIERQQTEYQSFWDDVGETFPSLKGAASTVYYFECERTIFEQFFPPLAGRTLFKTDLWDEAKNTEILRWAADQGARPFGIDIAFDVVQEARCVLAKHRPGFAMSDIRALPFPNDSFDLIIFQDVLEHVPYQSQLILEITRILKVNGIAIITTPDPLWAPVLSVAEKLKLKVEEGQHKFVFLSKLVKMILRKKKRSKNFARPSRVRASNWKETPNRCGQRKKS